MSAREATVDELLIGFQISRPKWTVTVRKEQKCTEGDKIRETKNDAKETETDTVI
jgi:hypothetical protein